MEFIIFEVNLNHVETSLPEQYPNENHYINHAMDEIDDYVSIAVQKEEEEDYTGALAVYSKVVEIDPCHFDAYNKMGYIKRFRFADYEGALICYNKALELRPDDAESLSGRSDVRYDLKDFQGSMDDLSIIIDLFNKSDSSDQESFKGWCEMAFFDRGYIRSELNDLDGAINDYSEAIKIDPFFFFAYSGRAAVKIKLNDFLGAIEDCNKSIKINQQFDDAFVVRGKAKFALKNYTGAINDFSKAIKRNPDSAEIYYNRGLAKMQLGGSHRGIFDLKKSEKLSQGKELKLF